jgi:hypothetical protein
MWSPLRHRLLVDVITTVLAALLGLLGCLCVNCICELLRRAPSAGLSDRQTSSHLPHAAVVTVLPACDLYVMCGCRHRLLVDVITTVPFDAIVLAALRLPEGNTSRFVSMLGLLKLGRMYRVGVMFRNMSFNLNLGLFALTLLRNFTVRSSLNNCTCSAFSRYERG